MIKIGQKIAQSIIRYKRKNTISARYERYQARANLFTLATGVQLFRFPYWEPVSDITITSFLGTFALKNFKESFNLLKDLRAIKKRAVSIKNAARLKNKHINYA